MRCRGCYGCRAKPMRTPERGVHYTVMPDYGGAYAWINREGTAALGPNCADTASWAGDHPISDALHAAFTDWQREFECAAFAFVESSVVALDWIAYHERGIELAWRLKNELGAAARVFYEKPIEDPNVYLDERREVLRDGSLRKEPARSGLFRLPPAWLPRMIISGGQTGVDRAALDWACIHRIPHGGWCPQGRLAEDGPIAPFYQLRETLSAAYHKRTRLNVRDSDATLILNAGALDGGTLQTLHLAKRMRKPYRVVQLDATERQAAAREIVVWLSERRFELLNIAGPREARRPGIYALVKEMLDRCFEVGPDASVGTPR